MEVAAIVHRQEITAAPVHAAVPIALATATAPAARTPVFHVAARAPPAMPLHVVARELNANAAAAIVLAAVELDVNVAAAIARVRQRISVFR